MCVANRTQKHYRICHTNVKTLIPDAECKLRLRDKDQWGAAKGNHSLFL